MELSKAVLSEVSLFRSLPDAELAHLSERLQTIRLAPGEVLFREGDPGEHLYVILDGQVEVLKAMGSVDERLVGVRRPGEYFGEMGLVDLDRLRTASVRALEPVKLMQLSREDFNDLMDRNPHLAFEFVRVLSKRLDESHVSAMRDLQAKNQLLQQAYDNLKAAQMQLIEKEKLERELQVAHNIQMSILPREIPRLPGFTFDTRILPMASVGGDFYDFIPLGNNQVGIVMGDVSGHGVPAALFMAMTSTLVRSAACQDCSPEQVVQHVNTQLLVHNDERLFVTMLYGVLSCETGVFTFVRAGHELPLVCTSRGELMEVEAGKTAVLGLFSDAEFETQSLPLEPGSKMLIYTDGVTEAMSKSRVMFGDARVQSALLSSCQRSAGEICDSMLKQLADHIVGVAQQDDIALLCVQADG